MGEGTDELVSLLLRPPSPPAPASLLQSPGWVSAPHRLPRHLVALGCQELPSHSLIPTAFKRQTLLGKEIRFLE